MKRTVITSTAIAALATLFAVSASAQKRDREGFEGKHEGKIARMVEKLDLTAEQQLKIKDLKKEQMAEAKPLHARLAELRKQMKVQWKAENPDEETIISIHRKAHKIKGQLKELKIEFRLDVYSILTPEQKVKAKQMMQERKQNRKGHGKKQRGEGHGKKRGHRQGQQ